MFDTVENFSIELRESGFCIISAVMDEIKVSKYSSLRTLREVFRGKCWSKEAIEIFHKYPIAFEIFLENWKNNCKFLFSEKAKKKITGKIQKGFPSELLLRFEIL